MVRRLNTDGWKALPLVVLAVGGLVWHVLACVESPMAFSPGGDLAFVTMDPYAHAEDLVLCGAHTYRLMVLPAAATEVKVLEESSHWMIMAPDYSADGRRLAYFRIPLLTPEGLSSAEAAMKSRTEAARAATQPASRPAPAETVWPLGPELKILLEAGASAPPPSASLVDLSLPSVESLIAAHAAVMAGPMVPAQLVERDTASGNLLSMTWVKLPLALGGEADKEGLSRGLLLAYLIGRARYSGDGQWVYFCCGGLEETGSAVVGVNPSTQTQVIFGAGAVAAALSPDGKTVATLQKGCLGFLRTDGAAAGYVRCETSISLAGLAWADKDTLAILRTDKIADKPVRTLSFVKADGTITKTVSLPEMAAENDADSGQLALSPDGRHVVVAFDKKAYFLDSTGALLMTWGGGDKELLACPAFTPDGKKVAFKVLTQGEKDTAYVTAVAFFSPAGQELHRVQLPLTRPPQTQPAETQPATMPAEPTSKPTAILELPPTLTIQPPRPTTQPATAPATQPAPASAPAVKLNPDQEKALQELAPELP